MTETPARLPIHRGLVAERKARLQQIKALNESPRRRHHVPGSDSAPDSEGYDYRTAFESSTSTTGPSSPRRSTRSLLSTYVSNNNLSEVLRRRASAVTIAGPYPSAKERSARAFRRTPTPFRGTDNSSSAQDATPAPHMSRMTDGSGVSTDRSKGKARIPPEISANVELQQPTPQNVRLKLADGLERGISDMSLRFSAATMTPGRTSGISRSPSDGDFARVVSQAMDDTSEGSNEPLDLTLRPMDSQNTIRVSKETTQGALPDAVPESGTVGRKRTHLRSLLKGRSQTAGEEESIHTVNEGKTKLRRIFSSRSKRTASDMSNNDQGVMRTEYVGNQLVVRKCCNGHESVAVLSDKGVTVALLTITTEGWKIGNVNSKDKQRKCAVCDCSD